MTQKILGNFARLALWFSPVVIVAAALVVATPSLRQHNPAVAKVLGAAAAIFVVGYSFIISQKFQQRFNERLDEVQLAHQLFANARGWIWGAMATILLATLPPVMNGMAELVSGLASMLGSGSPDLNNSRAVRLAFIFGVCLVTLMQTLGVVVAAIIWQRRIGGPVWSRRSGGRGE